MDHVVDLGSWLAHQPHFLLPITDIVIRFSVVVPLKILVVADVLGCTEGGGSIISTDVRMFKRQEAKSIDNHLARASDESHSDSHYELELTEAANVVPCLFY